LVFVDVEHTGSELPIRPTTSGMLAHLTKTVGRRESVEGRGTGVGRRGHEEEWCRR